MQKSTFRSSIIAAALIASFSMAYASNDKGSDKDSGSNTATGGAGGAGGHGGLGGAGGTGGTGYGGAGAGYSRGFCAGAA